MELLGSVESIKNEIGLHQLYPYGTVFLCRELQALTLLTTFNIYKVINFFPYFTALF